MRTNDVALVEALPRKGYAPTGVLSGDTCESVFYISARLWCFKDVSRRCRAPGVRGPVADITILAS
jgi:hypothetical protein